MATWGEMARDNRLAAKELSLAGRYRSSINRAYYAAYCAVASVLEGQVDFGHDGNNPAHGQLEPLILNMGSLTRNGRYTLQKAVRRLRGFRVLADYVPASESGKTTATVGIQDINRVFAILGLDE